MKVVPFGSKTRRWSISRTGWRAQEASIRERSVLEVTVKVTRSYTEARRSFTEILVRDGSASPDAKLHKSTSVELRRASV